MAGTGFVQILICISRARLELVREFWESIGSLGHPFEPLVMFKASVPALITPPICMSEWSGEMFWEL